MTTRRDRPCSWVERRPQDPVPGGVRRMLVAEHDGEEVLYLATTHGVYRYRSLD